MDCRNSGTQSFSSVMMTRTWCTWDSRKEIELVKMQSESRQKKKNKKKGQRPNTVSSISGVCLETHNGLHMNHGTVNHGDKKEFGKKGCNEMILQSSSERH